MSENVNYFIFEYTEVNKIDFNEVIEISEDNLRLSIDKQNSLFKIQGTFKDFMSTMTSLNGPYTHSQIKTILKGPEWSQSE